jgi:hypothetical protein
MTGDPALRPLDARQLLETLARHGVDYTIIGGIAVQVHGHRRTTKDLDIVPAPDDENYARLAAALAELDATPLELPAAGAPSADQLRTAPIVPPLLTRHGELHVVNQVPGAAPYAELRSRAVVIELDGLELAIAGLDDLIAMKRAAGREADMRDIAVLTALENEA